MAGRAVVVLAYVYAASALNCTAVELHVGACPSGMDLLPLEAMTECKAAVCNELADWSQARGASVDWVILGRGLEPNCSVSEANATEVLSLLCIVSSPSPSPTPSPPTPSPPTPSPPTPVPPTPSPPTPAPPPASNTTTTTEPPAPSRWPFQELTPGSVFLVIFFVALIAYCGGGLVVNLFLGARGASVVPHWHFWQSLPGLMLDGARFLCCRPPKAAYEHIPP
eukprot:TRINITY_DN354_c0_g2_i1.p1 TRINITY_DN354_c0_g2~~TRINITY_DN354_c0_g2_i1.p1  ORF type:complete len:259 (+),score=27.17 TRINITY_DN354_c0_g2_i1:106-777(+)